MIRDYIELMRWRDWVKNIFFLIPLAFYPKLIDAQLILLFAVGFISISLMSSVNYILNDIVDRKKDAKHPDKKLRPIAAGKISVERGIIFSAVLFAISLITGIFINIYFVLCAAGLFLMGLLYSFILKKQKGGFLVIPVNYVLRVYAGVVTITNLVMSDIAAVFLIYFMILFMVAEKKLVQKEIKKYTADVLVIISFLGSFSSGIVLAFLNNRIVSVLLVIPLIGGMYRTKKLIEKESDYVKRAYLLFKDFIFLISVLVFIILAIVIGGLYP